MIFYQIGEILQERAVSRSYRSIRELIDINPEFAHLREGTMIKTVAPRLVNVGDIIVVRPGGERYLWMAGCWKEHPLWTSPP